MVEFFRGWRRKVGMLTLGVAVLGMLGWVRSLTIHDEIEIAFESRVYSIASLAGTIDWQIKQWHNDFLPVETIVWTATPTDPWIPRALWLRTIRSDMIYNGKKLAWSGRGIRIPYWIGVLPLTALSAFLVLPKPRKSTQNTNPEPTSIETA
jgi:hypothetical protein